MWIAFIVALAVGLPSFYALLVMFDEALDQAERDETLDELWRDDDGAAAA